MSADCQQGGGLTKLSADCQQGGGRKLPNLASADIWMTPWWCYGNVSAGDVMEMLQ